MTLFPVHPVDAVRRDLLQVRNRTLLERTLALLVITALEFLDIGHRGRSGRGSRGRGRTRQSTRGQRALSSALLSFFYRTRAAGGLSYQRV